jgi:hypothetical protein
VKTSLFEAPASMERNDSPIASPKRQEPRKSAVKVKGSSSFEKKEELLVVSPSAYLLTVYHFGTSI